MTDAKFKLEDILNKTKAPPQILDLANLKIESDEDFKAVIEKIPDYRIKPERVREVRLPVLFLLRSIYKFGEAKEDGKGEGEILKEASLMRRGGKSSSLLSRSASSRH